jgi:hypothetical protein
MAHGIAFPPARRIVVLGDFVEAKLFVIIGANPLGGIDRATLKRRIDVATGNLLGDNAQTCDHRAAGAADAHLDALEILERTDFLAPPAAHLGAGVAAFEGDDIVLAEEFVEQLLAAAVDHPCVLRTLRHQERHGRCDAESRILAEIVVDCGVRHFDRACRNGIDRLEAANDFACAKGLDLEAPIGHFLDVLCDRFRRTIDCVERLRKTRGQTPLEGWHGLGDGRHGHGGGSAGDCGTLQKLTTLHESGSS